MKVLSFDIWDYLHFFYTSDKYLVILHGSVKSELCTKAKLKVDHTNAYQGDKIQFSMFMYVLLRILHVINDGKLDSSVKI